VVIFASPAAAALTAATPPFPEAALRAVLSTAVAAWARQPEADGSQSAEDAPRRLYVDAFAGAELQFGSGVAREAWEPMRAEAAIRALDRACAGPAPRPIAVFVEEDPAHLQRIYGELEELVGGERLRATRDLASLAAGEASLVEAPFASLAAEVARFAAGGRAFFWLAPATARALPWDAIAPLLAVPGATLLIRVPHADFEKQSRHGGSLADLPGFARRIVEGCSALLADPKHAWLPAWRADAREGTAAALAGVLERFRALLARAAGDRIVKPVQLDSPDGARAWCFLVTSDAAVARAVDGDEDEAPGEVVEPRAEIANPAPVPASDVTTDDATTGEPAPVSEPANRDAATVERVAAVTEDAAPRKPARVRKAARGDAAPAESKPVPQLADSAAPPVQPASPSAPAEPERAAPVAEVLDLFPDDVASLEAAAPSRPDAAALGAVVEGRFGARTTTWGEVAASFAASGVTVDEVKAALRHLRRNGRATYTALRVATDEIDFPSEPVAPAKANRRTKPITDDGLFGSGE
jgi:hypothetical protein